MLQVCTWGVVMMERWERAGGQLCRVAKACWTWPRLWKQPTKPKATGKVQEAPVLPLPPIRPAQCVSHWKKAWVEPGLYLTG